MKGLSHPEGRSTQVCTGSAIFAKGVSKSVQVLCNGIEAVMVGKLLSRTRVPNTTRGMVFGARDLKYWVLGPSGIGSYKGPSKKSQPQNQGRSKTLKRY